MTPTATAARRQLSNLVRPLTHSAQGSNIPFRNPSLRYSAWPRPVEVRVFRKVFVFRAFIDVGRISCKQTIPARGPQTKVLYELCRAIGSSSRQVDTRRIMDDVSQEMLTGLKKSHTHAPCWQCVSFSIPEIPALHLHAL